MAVIEGTSIIEAAFSKDGELLVVCRDYQPATIHEVETGRRVAEFKRGCHDPAFIGDTSHLTTRINLDVFHWNGRTGKEITSWKKAHAVTFSRDGSRLVFARESYKGFLADPSGKKEDIQFEFTHRGRPSMIRGFSFTPSGDRFLVMGFEHVEVRSAKTGEVLFHREGEGGGLRHALTALSSRA